MAFEELNDQGSNTTVFRAWNTVSTSLHDQTTHTDIRGSNLDDTSMYGIFQKLAQCAPLSDYEENTQQTWSVTLLAPDA